MADPVDRPAVQEGGAERPFPPGDYDVVALDEFTYPLAYGWLPVEEVIEFLRQRPARTHVIITGRDAPQELIDYADLVTEMREVKHPFRQGLLAQRGFDF